MFLVLFTFGCANLDVIHYGSSGLLGGGAEKTYWNGRYLLEPNYSNNFESVIWISEKASITDVKIIAFVILSS